MRADQALAADGGAQLHAVDVGHPQVDDGDVGRVEADALERGPAGAGLADHLDLRPAPQQADDRVPKQRVVVDHQDPVALHGGSLSPAPTAPPGWSRLLRSEEARDVTRRVVRWSRERRGGATLQANRGSEGAHHDHRRGRPPPGQPHDRQRPLRRHARARSAAAAELLTEDMHLDGARLAPSRRRRTTAARRWAPT